MAILGSVVTTSTYIKHKNIDLKCGWIMLACIVGMCTISSFAAWKVGNVVLGGFTLFLTFCIGIRFLVKPTTERKDSAAKGEKLDWKGMSVATVTSLWSAKFANRVGNRTVGLVTGAVLTTMGTLPVPVVNSIVLLLFHFAAIG